MVTGDEEGMRRKGFDAGTATAQLMGHGEVDTTRLTQHKMEVID